MGSFSDYLENKLLDHAFGAVTYTPPATLYAALFTVAPTDSGGGTEVTGGSYARVAITNNATNLPNSSGGAKANGTAITFPAATASWGTVVAMALFDAASGGNLMCHAALATSKVITSGDTASFPTGDLDITLD